MTVHFANSGHQAIADPNPIETNYAPRSVNLRRGDFITHGYTGGCAGCEFLATGLGGRKGHSVECRLRMEDLLANDDEGKHRVKVAAERKDVWVSKQIEKGDENAIDKSVPVDLQEIEKQTLRMQTHRCVPQC